MTFAKEGEVEPLWDADDVALFLKASRSWVYHRAEAGKLPCLRIGGLLRFQPAAIRAFVGGGSPPASLGAPPHGSKGR